MMEGTPLAQEDTGTLASTQVESLQGRLEWAGPVPWWQRRGIHFCGTSPGNVPNRPRWARLQRTDGAVSAPLVLRAARPDTDASVEIWLQDQEILALRPLPDGELLVPDLDPWGATLELLRREWPLTLFLFGPVLGVVLVNAIFGMPMFLWWTALAVLIFSMGVMGILLRKDLRRLQRWLDRQAEIRNHPHRS